jgi:predicted nucleotidyltransferase component of viral defense system
MISLEEIKTYFTEGLRKNPAHSEYMLKEYFHYRMLDKIYSGEYASKMIFIGGTNLRILHQIQRFSEE